MYPGPAGCAHAVPGAVLKTPVPTHTLRARARLGRRFFQALRQGGQPAPRTVAWTTSSRSIAICITRAWNHGRAHTGGGKNTIPMSPFLPNLSHYDRLVMFADVRKYHPEWQRLSVWVGRGTLRRFDRSIQALYKRCKHPTKNARFPRFKPRHRWKSIEIVNTQSSGSEGTTVSPRHSNFTRPSGRPSTIGAQLTRLRTYSPARAFMLDRSFPDQRTCLRALGYQDKRGVPKGRRPVSQSSMPKHRSCSGRWLFLSAAFRTVLNVRALRWSGFHPSDHRTHR